MKKVVSLITILAFLTASCHVTKQKDNNIHVDHSKEKNQFRISQKNYKSQKKCETWK